jgi:hypothetical protein
LGIRKLKIEKNFSLSKAAKSTNKLFIYLFIYLFRVHADAAQRPRGQERGGRERGEVKEMRPRGHWGASQIFIIIFNYFLLFIIFF